jgi:hypothetical protein
LLLQLQRSVGNAAVARLLIQRKPADINQAHGVTFNNKGPTGVTKAPRVKGLKPALLINAQVKDGWVIPSTDKLKGGHLLKAQYGGADDPTNVVSWSETCEASFGLYEEAYANEAMKQARIGKQPVTITLAKAATFADRPDLKLTDQEAEAAGWTAGDPERKKRQDKYDEIAENFSTIPTKVTVTISGLTTNPAPFERNGQDLAPDFKKSDAAIKPGFAPYVRFKVNPGLPRTLATITDWNAMKASVKSGSDGDRYGKLAHVKGRHGDQFGVGKATDYDGLKAFEDIIEKFIADTAHTQIEGEYQGMAVIHYFDEPTQLWVCTDPTNELVAGFKLGPMQAASLKAKGVVK